MNDQLKSQCTAWALDELDATERAALEATLGTDASVRGYAEETRDFCALLGTTLAAPDPALSEEQRRVLTAQLTAPAPATIVRFPFARVALTLGLGGAAAAALAVFSGHFAPTREKIPSVAVNDGLAARENVRRASADDFLTATSTPAPAVDAPTPAPAPVQEQEVLRSADEKQGLVAERSAALADAEPQPEMAAGAKDAPVTGERLAKSLGAVDGTAPASAPLGGAAKSEGALKTNGTEADFAGGPASGPTPTRVASSPANEPVPPTVPKAKKALEAEYRYLKEASDRDDSRRERLDEVVRAPQETAFDVSSGLALPVAPGTEAYATTPENHFLPVASAPLSTFSIDVDTASYANVRRFLNGGQRPPAAAVRLEELINYFSYDYPQPEAGKPFSVSVDLTECPWQPQHRLARVGLKGREMPASERPPCNLVFLLDVSGSMDAPNKLPLVKQSLRFLTDQLTERDHVSLVTYAGQSGVVLPSTPASDKAKITAAIESLRPGGSTNGASGIQLAYEQAKAHFLKEGVNRVLIATDGDFNVGVTSREALQDIITEQAKGGTFLSVLGYGAGNLKDATMEMLADKGNGNYAYIDSLGEARKVLGEQMASTLVTIAKDVKIQVEFNPSVVTSYRLLGYENRLLAKEDFNDDRKDAGEIGAGHTVTALYEIVPVGVQPPPPPVDPLKYQPADAPATPAAAVKPAAPASNETMTVKLRWKAPDGDTSQLQEVPVVDKEAKFAEASADMKFATSVTLFGLLLKDSAHKGTATWDLVRKLALEGKGADPLGYRGEFIQLTDKARAVAP